MLPSPLIELLASQYGIQILGVESVGGGSINNSVRLNTSAGKFFLKWHTASPAGMFPLEAEGLDALRQTHTVRVPEVIAAHDPTPTIPGYILMEWIETARHQPASMAMLGEQLAALHLFREARQQNPVKYGWRHDNYLGSTSQRNPWRDHWLDFFRECRLGFQMELASARGLLPPARRSRLEQLLDRLDKFLPAESEAPSLLHGDLWGGNAIFTSGGYPVLIDPAVYYGDREAEIAFTELFGGFTDGFYQAYKSNDPLQPGYNERRDLYNLYHLLNHLNLFGEPYGDEVDSILRRYIG